jgi:hypothetical protein
LVSGIGTSPAGAVSFATRSTTRRPGPPAKRKVVSSASAAFPSGITQSLCTTSAPSRAERSWRWTMVPFFDWSLTASELPQKSTPATSP